MASSVLNSSSVLRLNFCAKLNICASISATSPSCNPLCVMQNHDYVKRKFEMRILTYLFLFIQFGIYGQTNEIISKFQSEKLPYCISYPENESDSFNQVNNDSKNDSLSLSSELVKTLFVPKKKLNLEEGIDENLDSNYFADKMIIKKNNFCALTYERVIKDSNGSTETYLCTIDDKGICISVILIASSLYNGTGTLENGDRFPYYEQTESCIKKDLSIIVKPRNGNMKEYQIKDDGEIIETK